MAYQIDDDETRIQDLKDRISDLEIQTLSQSVVARNQSTRHTGIQAGVSNPFPLKPPIFNLGILDSVFPNTIPLNRADSHVFKFTIDGDTDITFISDGNLKKMMQFVLDITQDALGGHTLNILDPVQPSPTIGSGANQRTIINLQTTDGGSSYQITSQVII